MYMCVDTSLSLPVSSELTVYKLTNPLYTETRYNDKIRYNDFMTGTKPSLTSWQLIRNYARTFYL